MALASRNLLDTSNPSALTPNLLLDEQLDRVVDQLAPFVELDRELDPDAFQTLPQLPSPGRLVAVDGSHRLLLDGRSFLIIALRAGTVTYQGPSPAGASAPLEVRFLSKSDYGRALREAWEALAPPLGLEGWDDPVGSDLQAAPERLRELGEWLAATRALKELEAGDLLVLDGALRSPTRQGQAVLEGLARQAERQGVGLAAVAKRSALSLGSLPLLPALERLAGRLKLRGGWAYPLDPVVQARSAGQIWAVNFTPGAPTAFRVDVAGGLEPLEVLGRLGGYCLDVLYPGYPHPLARIHNQVFLSAQEGRDLTQALQSRTLAAGLPPGAWQVLFADFHQVLDRSV